MQLAIRAKDVFGDPTARPERSNHERWRHLRLGDRPTYDPNESAAGRDQNNDGPPANGIRIETNENFLDPIDPATDQQANQR